MKAYKLETYWPLKEVRDNDLYFYMEEIEAYLPDCRVMVAGQKEPMILLGGYSYLGLNGHPTINRTAQKVIENYGTGTNGVRLLAGTLKLHHQLEQRVAAFKQTESAITFTSGYIANLSVIAGLVGKDDTVICDKLDHASIVDGCSLSQAKYVRFCHNDMGDLERCLVESSTVGKKLVIVDAVFSMDGDIINLPEVCRLCQQYDAWLMVDEAHSIGVLGKTGHGIEEHFDLPSDCIDIKMGTFSKAIPSVGGYVAGSYELCDFLKHQARGFVYSAALPPTAAAAALAALDVIDAEPDRVHSLHENIQYFASRLKEFGFSGITGVTPIFPIICGEDQTAMKLARYCQKKGIYVQAIPYPIVSKNKARLRAAVSSLHRKEDLDYCAKVIAEGACEIGGILR